jgi:hypothetical protein
MTVTEMVEELQAQQSMLKEQLAKPLKHKTK